jgi:hypothetical protein
LAAFPCCCRLHLLISALLLGEPLLFHEPSFVCFRLL